MKSRLKQQIFAISLLACTAISPANALQTHLLREQFQNPSDEAKPWTFSVLDVWSRIQRRGSRLTWKQWNVLGWEVLI